LILPGIMTERGVSVGTGELLPGTRAPLFNDNVNVNDNENDDEDVDDNENDNEKI